MNRNLRDLRRFLSILLSSILLLFGSALHAEDVPISAADLAGDWQGTLSFSGAELRLVLHLTPKEDGTLGATLDSPDQGATGIPVNAVTLTGDSLRLDVAVVRGGFVGVVGEDRASIEGSWSQAGLSLPLVLRRSKEKITLRRPQEPKKPYPYLEEEVRYENAAGGVTLAGTLTLPKGSGPFPAVLLISGSGAENRDEEVFGHRPFWILADDLTRRGIAVLRVDDRGVGGSTGSTAASTTEDFAGDVLAGVDYLEQRPEIDTACIGLIGHSEGGLIAPMAAVRSRDVAFIVLMAGPGLPGKDIILLQSAIIARADSTSEEEIARNRKLQERLFEVIESTPDSTAAARKLRSILKETLDALNEEERGRLNDPEANLDAQIHSLLSPWFRFFLSYDPRPTLEKVRCPVLALGGEKDLQVPAKENLAAIEKALKAGGNQHFRVIELPGLNHLFQTCTTGSPSEYSRIEETIAPKALQTIGDWIESVCGRSPGSGG